MTIDAKTYLGKTVKVVIDRPLDSLHPKFGFRYPINYGYIKSTRSRDGEELDAYVLGAKIPLKEFEGKCIAVIHRLDDDEDKLVVVPAERANLSDEAIVRDTQFQEKFFKSEIIR